MKELLDARAAPISIASLLVLQDKITKSAFTQGDIINLASKDLQMIITALEFTYGIKDQLTCIQEGINILIGVDPNKKPEDMSKEAIIPPAMEDNSSDDVPQQEKASV